MYIFKYAHLQINLNVCYARVTPDSCHTSNNSNTNNHNNINGNINVTVIVVLIINYMLKMCESARELT